MTPISTQPLKAGHFVMVDMEGTALDTDTAMFLREHQIRAVCLFRKNLGTQAQVRALTADLRAAMGEHALIAIDQEGGSVVRATFLPQAPSAMALGAADDLALAQEVGAAVARGLRSLGINWNFAPVLDVNNNPANPVIAERSFSADPLAVTRLAGAWMEGSLAQGVACCVKHFPGHGDTHTDSHHALPCVDKSMAELEALELQPFRALASVAPAVMTAHIVYPQIDPEHPATLSRPVLTGILRQSLGFGGVVITDALMMKAVHDRYGHARAAILSLQAGADLVLAQGARHEQIAALDAIEAALANGTLDHSMLRAARLRTEALAERFPVAPQHYRRSEQCADQDLMERAWARSLTIVGSAVPPPNSAPLRVVCQANVHSDGVSEAGVPMDAIQTLFADFSNVQFQGLTELRALHPEQWVDDDRTTILVSNHRQRYGAQARTVGVDLHLVLWNPFQVLDIAAPAVVTWGFGHGALTALRRWLQGNASAPGRAPVPLDAAPPNTPQLAVAP